MGKLFRNFCDIPDPGGHEVAARCFFQGAVNSIDSANESLLLLGSFATGRHTLRSDLDFFALVYPEDAEELRGLANDVTAQTLVPIELHVESPINWVMPQNASPSYHNAVRTSPRIARSGLLCVVGRDPNEIIDAAVEPITPDDAYRFPLMRYLKQKARNEKDDSRACHPDDAQSYLELPTKLALRSIELAIFGFDPRDLDQMIADTTCQQLRRLDREYTAAATAAKTQTKPASLPELDTFAREVNVIGFQALKQAVEALEKTVSEETGKEPLRVTSVEYEARREAALENFYSTGLVVSELV